MTNVRLLLHRIRMPLSIVLVRAHHVVRRHLIGILLLLLVLLLLLGMVLLHLRMRIVMHTVVLLLLWLLLLLLLGRCLRLAMMGQVAQRGNVKVLVAERWGVKCLLGGHVVLAEQGARWQRVQLGLWTVVLGNGQAHV